MSDYGGLWISNVRVALTSDSGTQMVALCNFTFNKRFTVRGIRIIRCKSGRHLVVMPDHQRNDGVFISTAFPTDDALRRRIELEILREYVAESQREWGRRLAELEDDDEPFHAP